MKVILLQDVAALGRKNDIKEVSDGYGRNFLLPRRLAAAATPAAIAALAAQKTRADRGVETECARHQAIAKKLAGMTLTLKTKIGEKGKAFGSVTAAKICDTLKQRGIAVEKEWIALAESIKTVGEHTVEIKFPHGIMGEVKVVVEAE